MISYSNLIQIAAAPKLNSGLFLILKKKKMGTFFLRQYSQCLCNYITPLVHDSKLTQIKPST